MVFIGFCMEKKSLFIDQKRISNTEIEIAKVSLHINILSKTNCFWNNISQKVFFLIDFKKWNPP